MMNTKSLASLLFAVLLAASAHAFSTRGPSNRAKVVSQPSVGSLPSYTGASSSTSLNLKVKVDPSKAKNSNAAGNAKMAAYGGSIAVAALLPVAFLIWSLVSKP